MEPIRRQQLIKATMAAIDPGGVRSLALREDLRGHHSRMLLNCILALIGGYALI